MMEKNYFADLIEKCKTTIRAYNFNQHPANFVVTRIITDFDVLYTISGRYLITINEKQYVSTAGDVLILPPNSILTLKCPEFSTHYYCHFLLTNINGTELTGNFTEYRLPRHCGGLADMYKREFDLYTERKLPLFSSVGLIFKLFLLEMLRAYPQNQVTYAFDSQRAIPTGILQTLDYIHTHLQQNVTVETLAKIAGFNTSYFSRHFKKYMGTSPVKYINNHKMNFAKYFISTTDLSLKEISFLLGFTDQFGFSKKFRKYYGISPSKFRQINI